MKFKKLTFEIAPRLIWCYPDFRCEMGTSQRDLFGREGRLRIVSQDKMFSQAKADGAAKAPPSSTRSIRAVRIPVLRAPWRTRRVVLAAPAGGALASTLYARSALVSRPCRGWKHPHARSMFVRPPPRVPLHHPQCLPILRRAKNLPLAPLHTSAFKPLWQGGGAQFVFNFNFQAPAAAPGGGQVTAATAPAFPHHVLCS